MTTRISESQVGSKKDVKKRSSKKNKKRKIGRNKEKCAAYRLRVGKPLGPGVPGNKAGKNRVKRDRD